MHRKKVVLCGNPNVGKSTVFNALTGLRQHTGNWAGKTVETAKGVVRFAESEWELIDLPGTYSYLGCSPDEEVASDYLLFGEYDAAIVVCDACCLARSLVLALQTATVCRHTILCVNLLDEAEKQGIGIDLERLAHLTSLPTVGICAKTGKGLEQLNALVAATGNAEEKDGNRPPLFPTPKDRAAEAVRNTAERLRSAGCRDCVCMPVAIRLLFAGAEAQESLLHCSGIVDPDAKAPITGCLDDISQEEKLRFRMALTAVEYADAEQIVQACTNGTREELAEKRLRTDRLLCSPAVGIPLMILLLFLVFYLTLCGANSPSRWLSHLLMSFEPTLAEWLFGTGLPQWLSDAVAHGMYRSLAWVVSVMLPPMAIFFPLFTLLEDLGYLPRIAFNLDRCFHRCNACGKQALCMCMGLGCNAVGVTGCRIIQSPRERMLAILTNALIPCNGRLPLLVTLISVAFSGSSGNSPFLSAAVLAGLLVLAVLVTLLVSKLLSCTLLRGMGSAFVLELPTFRMPRVGQVVLRSVLDRTVFVLLRAVSVAAPAGLLLWLLGNLRVDGLPLLHYGANWLDPFGRFLGMDGVILMAFLLGLPANEIVLPIMLMIYLQQGSLMDPAQAGVLAELLKHNGWSGLTAFSCALFTMFHWPCSTTILTIRKETGSLLWTVAAVLIPTAAGVTLCAFVTGVVRLLGLV